MTIKTRVHGYTAWVNMRLTPFEHSLNNILMDLLRGTNMKYLLQSFTGFKNEKFTSFENMTTDQLQTRIKWFLKDLKESHVIAEDTTLDTRLFAVRSAKHVFELLWRLVCHDIYFLWERIDFLTENNEETLIKVPFNWVPRSPMENAVKINTNVSQLTGFGSVYGNSVDNDQLSQTREAPKRVYSSKNMRYPGFDFIKTFSLRNGELKQAPLPKNCIIEMINCQLKKVPEGSRIKFTKLDELSDTRVLCGLINSFIPNLFPTEILLNDRWSINLVLRCVDQVLMCNSTIDSEDLVEAEPQSICAFFCYLFMMFYKFKQCRAVTNRYKYLEINLKKLGKYINNELLDKNVKLNIQENYDFLNTEMQELSAKYDIKRYVKWVERVEKIKIQIHELICNKFRTKFDWFVLNEDITVANLVYNQAINLSLTNGVSFYQLNAKESMSRDRKVIVKFKNDKSNFVFNFANNSDIFRRVLRLPNLEMIDVNPSEFPNMDIYVDCLSNNKILKKGTVFLYQVFPQHISFYHRILTKACHENDLETVRRLVEFFATFDLTFVNLREAKSLNSALHIAAHNGFFDLLLILLDNYADVNIKNKDGNTPLMLAADACQRDCLKLLLEYGADVNIKNNRRNTVLTQPLGAEMKAFVQRCVQYISDILPSLRRGDEVAINRIIDAHINREAAFCTIRSRLLNGQSLVHVCAIQNKYDLLEKLLNVEDIDHKPIDPNIKDFTGATALHLAKNARIIQLLLDYGANVNATDLEGNTPLHNRCVGERNKPSEMDLIDLLVANKADLLAKNKKHLLPIHMASLQGRVDIIESMLKNDSHNAIQTALVKNSEHSPTYLALTNDYQDCAAWLMKNGFNLRKNEPDLILFKMLTENIVIKNVREMILLLCANGCDLNKKYSSGNTVLHLAATMSNKSDEAISTLVEKGASLNALNDEMRTPLFLSVLANNPLGASALIKLNADYTLKDKSGKFAFESIKEIGEWMSTGLFDENTKRALKDSEYKQTCDLIRSISRKIKPDFSSRAMLIERHKTLNCYLNNHFLMLANRKL